MNGFNKLFVFTLIDRNYAIDLLSVEKGIHAVEITPVPENISTLMGIINIHGKIVPVIDIRKKLNLPPAEIDIDNYIVIVKILNRTAAFVADSIVGVMEVPDGNITTSDDILPGLANIEGIVKHRGEIILIHDLEKTLSVGMKDDIDAVCGSENG